MDHLLLNGSNISPYLLCSARSKALQLIQLNFEQSLQLCSCVDGHEDLLLCPVKRPTDEDPYGRGTLVRPDGQAPSTSNPCPAGPDLTAEGCLREAVCLTALQWICQLTEVRCGAWSDERRAPESQFVSSNLKIQMASQRVSRLLSGGMVIAW